MEKSIKNNKTLDSYFNVKTSNSTGKRKVEVNHDEDLQTEAEKGSKQKKNTNKNINEENNKIETSLDSYEDYVAGLGTWREPLKAFTNSEKMKNIFKFIEKEYESKIVYPPKELIFNAFNKTHWDNLKVVIIGQDPYPNEGQGMGLSFSVNRGIPVPKSLINIYKCLENDNKLNFKAPKHGDLSKWAEQGVFLLNATLTVIGKKANSHQKISGWSDFTDYVIKTISDKKEGIVFLLWGNFAIAKKKLINESKHHIIESIHPSPLAASKGDFTLSDQFSKANEFLVSKGDNPIDWSLPL